MLKTLPEDFIVEEIPSYSVDETGRYTYFELKKVNYTTLNAIKRVAERSRIDFKKFSFAGTKDKNAITTQVVSVANRLGKDIEHFGTEEVQLAFLGYGKEPISLGDLKGNYFRITVRNLDLVPKDIMAKTTFMNLFGEQRFSTNNARIGKLLIQGKAGEAAKLILETDKQYGKAMFFHLEKYKNDYVGALKNIPRKILTMYVHSYQSMLWNQAAEALWNEGVRENRAIPLVGFGTELGDDEISQIIMHLLKEEGISQRDLIIRNMPDLSSEGDSRQYLALARNLKVSEPKEDELNKGKKKIILEFDLDKGCYATEFVRQLFDE